MRKVFLDDLPRHNGKNNKIDWVRSVGHKIRFIYEDIEDEVEIVDHYVKNKHKYLDIKYNNNYLSISTSSFYKCGLGKLLGKRTNEYKYNVNDIITTKFGKIQILKQIKINNVKNYEYKCLIDDYIGETTEYSLNSGTSCPVCAGKKVLKGTNDLWTTNFETAKLLKYSEIGYEITYGSNKYQIFVCPNCGFEKSLLIRNVVNYGFPCPKCSDGLSYPNKFVHNFFEQLNEKCLFEHTPKWSNGKVYDICLPERNEVWEIHGLQHYEVSFISLSKKARTLEEEQNNDKLKMELAKQNGYKYIEIDARKSELKWIKNSIENLPEIKRYDLSKINWLKCHEFAICSLVKIACDYWNNGINSTFNIGNELKLNQHTISRYLKQGAELGWCDYNPKEVLIKNNRIQGKIQAEKRCKEVIQLSIDGEFIKKWESATEVQRQLGISQGGISAVCRGKQKTANGFKWILKEDYDKQYIKNKNNADE